MNCPIPKHAKHIRLASGIMLILIVLLPIASLYLPPHYPSPTKLHEGSNLYFAFKPLIHGGWTLWMLMLMGVGLVAAQKMQKHMYGFERRILGGLDLFVGVFALFFFIYVNGEFSRMQHELVYASALGNALMSMGGKPSGNITLTMISPWLALFGGLASLANGGFFVLEEVQAFLKKKRDEADRGMGEGVMTVGKAESTSAPTAPSALPEEPDSGSEKETRAEP